MFLTDLVFRQQENLVDNQKCQAGFRKLCNKILLLLAFLITSICETLSVIFLIKNQLPVHSFSQNSSTEVTLVYITVAAGTM